MSMVRIRHWLVVLFIIISCNVVFSVDIKTLTNKIPVFTANEKLDAELFIISGEPGYTLLLYKKSVSDRQIIAILKSVRTIIIVDDGYKAFFKVIGKTSAESSSLILCDARTGQIRNLGQFNYDRYSPDGKYLATFKYYGKTEIARGQIFNVETMDLLAEYNFNDLLAARLGKDKVNNNFDIALLYNVEMKGFEVLFDHYGELGSLTCTGFISIPELKFSFTDRKNELLKRMGLSK